MSEPTEESVEGLKAALKAERDGRKDDAKTFKTRITELETQNGELTTKVGTLETDVAAKTADLTKLEAPKAIKTALDELLKNPKYKGKIEVDEATIIGLVEDGYSPDTTAARIEKLFGNPKICPIVKAPDAGMSSAGVVGTVDPNATKKAGDPLGQLVLKATGGGAHP
jgi:hypothetical protein